ncbi:MAG TPA: hypothetical protein VFJ97_09030 [Dermatophilaceae bacterium]|nr:hypothetical protein [Dermatophilaceae bacterium]
MSQPAAPATRHTVALPAPPRPPAAGAGPFVLAAALAVGAIGAVGGGLALSGVRLHLAGGVLLRGPFEPAVSGWVLAPVLLAAVVVSAGHLAARRLPWPLLLVATWAGSICWGVGLAVSRAGPGGGVLGRPLTSPHEYLHDVARVADLGTLLATYVDSVPAGSAHPWTTHVAGHPPGPLAVFAGLDAVGLGGSGWAAALCIALGASAAPAVLVAVRSLHGREAVVALAPFLVLAPWALWVTTSADALWSGASAWAVALLTLAPRWRRVAPLAAGLLFGLSAFGSYGIVPLGLVLLAVLAGQRTRRALPWVAGGTLLPLLLAGSAGFWWWQGLAAAARRVTDGPAAQDRPYLYFVVANLAVAALALGPAVVAGLRQRVASLPLVWTAAAAVLLADITGLAKGEVERIWLPYYPWLTVAVLLLPRRGARSWLTAQAALALAIQLTVLTEW